MGSDSDLAWFSRHRLRLVTGFRLDVPRGQVPYHRHVHIELVWHRRGRGFTALPDGNGYAFSAGDCTVYPAGVDHGQDNDEAGEDVCLHLALPVAPPRILQCAHQARPDSAWGEELIALTTLVESPAQGSRLHRLALDLRASALLLRLLTMDPSGRTAQDPGHAAKAARFLAKHLHEQVSSDTVARHLGIGPDRLRHLFSAVHGCGMARYVIRLRVQKAQELLSGDSTDLTAVAQACGFATSRYLCTQFRNEVGCTPGEWRRRAAAAAPAMPARVSGTPARK